MKELNQYIDHSLLKPTATTADIVLLCDEAKQYNFYSVCVNSCFAYLASNELKNSKVRVVATVGFPLGTSSTKAKVIEAKKAIKDGADEIDMVLNIGFLKEDLCKSVREEISAVKKAIGKKILKVIIETCYLTDDEKIIASKIVKKAKADYIKTSTGFGTEGATLRDILLIKEIAGKKIKIKASGGINTQKQAFSYIKAGVHRIGTSSGIKLLFESKGKEV